MTHRKLICVVERRALDRAGSSLEQRGIIQVPHDAGAHRPCQTELDQRTGRLERWPIGRGGQDWAMKRRAFMDTGALKEIALAQTFSQTMIFE
jgi:hypothetical protein